MSADVLVLAAHPDDAELSMGGTIAALVAEGKKVVIVDLTSGEPTPYGSDEKRRAEAAGASACLNIHARVQLDLPNRALFDTEDARKQIAAVIRKWSPSTLFVHYPDDAHPDHLEASKLSIAARFYAKLHKSDIPGTPCFPKKIFYFYSIHKRMAIEPSFIFDVSKYIAVKLDAILTYHSQFVDNPNNQHIVDEVKTDGAYWGKQAGVAYGEPFAAFEPLLICSSEGFIL